VEVAADHVVAVGFDAARQGEQAVAVQEGRALRAVEGADDGGMAGVAQAAGEEGGLVAVAGR
jgi:hypothetical protein